MATDSLGRRISAREPRRALPNPQPAVALGAMLASRRRRGEPWDDGVFIRLGSAVVRDLHERERSEWMCVFRETAEAWEAGYDRSLTFRQGLFWAG